MTNYPKKRSAMYTVPFSMKLDPDLDRDMDFASANGYDMPENAREALRLHFKKLRDKIEAERGSQAS